MEWAYKYNGKAHLENKKASFVKWKRDSGRDRKEYGAAIASKVTEDGDNKSITLYTLGTTVSDEQGSADILSSTILDGWDLNDGVHTHPINGENNGETFSGETNSLMPWVKGDTYYAKQHDMNLYLATPQGFLLLYIPSTEATIEIDDNLPNHPYSNRDRSKNQKPSYTKKGDSYKLNTYEAPVIDVDNNDDEN